MNVQQPLSLQNFSDKDAISFLQQYGETLQRDTFSLRNNQYFMIAKDVNGKFKPM